MNKETACQILNITQPYTLKQVKRAFRLLALKYAYPLDSERLSKPYVIRGREILDQRMVQAGVRLADLLNQILKTKE